MMKSEKIVSALNTLQEGILEELRIENHDLNVKVECSYLADLVAPGYKYFYLVLKNVSGIEFRPWDEEETTVSQVEELRLLKMEIVNAEVTAEDRIKIFCNCANVYSGGNLEFVADDIRIFDEELNELTMESLSGLSEDHWYSEREAEG